jgi:predicted Rossmann fold flavoprotein
MNNAPIVVIGAGAAGLMAAIFAASSGSEASSRSEASSLSEASSRVAAPQRRTPVLLLERTRDGGRKILISGGGRCNILPAELEPARFVTDSSSHTLRNLLRSWPLAEQRAFFESTLAVPLALEADTGKYFPVSNSARDVRDALVHHAQRCGVEIRFNTHVVEISRCDDGISRRDDGCSRCDDGDSGAVAALETGAGRRRAEGWTVDIAGGGPPIEAAAVIFATGGLSVPATGSDGGGIAIARRLGHTVHDTYPALTPLVADPPIHAALAGISVRARLHAPRTRAQAGETMTADRGATPAAVARTCGGFLFTHRGYSGPAVLDISHVAVRARLEQRPQAIQVQWSFDHDEAAWHTRLQPRAGDGQTLVATRVRHELPNRLADWLVADAGIPTDRTLATLMRAERVALIARLCRYALPWTADEGYKKAEVTGGGVALDEVKARTLESRRHPGLFLCGEMLDAFGPIGGHNFAWAWATGRLAGLGAAAYVTEAAGFRIKMFRPPVR